MNLPLHPDHRRVRPPAGAPSRAEFSPEDHMSIRTRVTLLSALVLAGLALATLPESSAAQFGRKLKDAIKQTAENKAVDKTTETENKAIDDALSGSPAKDSSAAPAEGAGKAPDAAAGAAGAGAATA